MSTIEVKKTRFAGIGWDFEESHPDSCWQIVARKDQRTIVSRSNDRFSAWRGVFERIEERPTEIGA